MENNAYLEWINCYEATLNVYKDPKPADQTYKRFENKLLSAKEGDLYYIYREYIKQTKDPKRVNYLYKRALVKLCQIPSVWGNYIKFSFKKKEDVLTINEDALRYCPWSEKLWVWRLRVLEHYRFDKEKVVACFKEALSNTRPSSQLNLWLYYLEYNRRNFEDSTLERIFLSALQQITPEEDPTFKLHRWYARFEAKRGCEKKAKQIWTKTILTDPYMKVSADAWLEFARLQIEFGEPGQVRYGFRNALNCCKDGAPKIREEWLLFEREVGSLEEIIKCEEDCRKFMTDLAKRVGNKRTNETEQDCNSKRLKKSENMDQNVLPSTSKIIRKDPKTSVLVINLCDTVTEQDLKYFFSNALNVSIVLNSEETWHCSAYIQFANKEDFMSALAQDGVPLKGKPVQIFPMLSSSINEEMSAMQCNKKLYFVSINY